MRGGKQPGAGRPVGTTKEPTTPTSIRLTAPRSEQFKALGGNRWLNRVLDESIDAKAKAG